MAILLWIYVDIMKTLSMQEKRTAFLVNPVRMEDSTDYAAPGTGHLPVASGKLTLSWSLNK